MIPVLKPSCSEAEIAAVSETLRSGWWGMGPKCEEFEQRLAARYGYAHCITVNSATAALHLALLANGIGPGDEVIVPALTFVSTALAVTYCGARPVFCDVDAETLCLEWNQAAALWAVKQQVKAILPVDYAGYPAIYERLGWSNALIVQDAAHSIGGLAYGSEVCFSFHPVKPLATGDGGAILTNDAAKAERMRALRWCGIDRSTWQRSGKRYSWDYSIESVGYKCHWNDIQASIGLCQLERLDAMRERRRQIASYYTEGLRDWVETPADHPEHTWHLYVVRVPERDRFIDRMAGQGVSVGVHYKPLTHYHLWDEQPTPPVTEREWRRLASLPMYADLTDAEVERVVDAVRVACARG